MKPSSYHCLPSSLWNNPAVRARRRERCRRDAPPPGTFQMTFQDKEKKRQRGNMNLHSLLFRDLVVSAKVSIRRIKGGNNGTHLLPYSHVSRFASCFLSLYYSNTCVFVFVFLLPLSLSFPLYFFSFTKLVPLLPPGPSWSNYFSMTLESILFFSSSSPSDFRIRVSEEMEFFGPTHHNLVAGRWLVV